MDNEALIARMRAVLQELEWSVEFDDGLGVEQFCPVCSMAEGAGHSDQCELQAVLLATSASRPAHTQSSPSRAWTCGRRSPRTARHSTA